MTEPAIDPDPPMTWAKVATIVFIMAMIIVPGIILFNYFAEKYHWSLNLDPDTGSVEACYLKHDRKVIDLIDKVKPTLADPESFEHVETFFTPSNIVGRHSVLMKFHNKLPNGTVQTDKAVAEMRDADCKILEWFVMDR